jgi:hypothetical protein
MADFPIKKGSGVTPTEKYLARLCDESFLNLWSYPNTFRDEGKKEEGGAGKELCDLLVACDKHLLIFSEKNVPFPESGDLPTDWRRWVTRAVAKSARQVLGAERWIIQNPDRIFVDPLCTQRLPLEMPAENERVIHRIIVTRGASSACKAFFGSGNGSLIISNEKSPILQKPNGISFASDPFRIGDINPGGGFIHILDDFTLPILLRELDTITDFVGYLSEKEAFFRTDRHILAAGEEELLAFYFKSFDEESQRFKFKIEGENSDDPYNAIYIDEGHWEDLTKHPQYILKKEEDAISYMWDKLIEKFTNHMLAGTSIRESFPSEKNDTHEGGVRFMALESRVHRRSLARQLWDAIENAPSDRPTMRAILPSNSRNNTETGYLFLQVPVPDRDEFKEYDFYREFRRNFLHSYCIAMKGKFPNLPRVVGIAMEPPKHYRDRMKSEDILLMEVENWSPEMQQEADEIRKELCIFQDEKMKVGRYSTQEFPEIPKRQRVAKSAKYSTSSNRRERRRKAAIQRRKKPGR